MQTLFQAIMERFAKAGSNPPHPNAFKRADLSQTSTITSLKQLQHHPSIKTLVEMFEHCKLSAQSSFNQGSGVISFTIRRPENVLSLFLLFFSSFASYNNNKQTNKQTIKQLPTTTTKTSSQRGCCA
eukprot:c21879_g1_i1.p1 GENE.c21879_g1_i1~~c21879_g1_i1.p1  ORF type:complete len:127 (+),score=27.82 c21879_g1_i1:49-429(+)